MTASTLGAALVGGAVLGGTPGGRATANGSNPTRIATPVIITVAPPETLTILLGLVELPRRA